MLALLIGGGAARAQGPTIDPTFQPTAVYKPASIGQVVQQPDGTRLVVGGIIRAGHQPAGQLVRLLANSNAPDSVFTSNVQGIQGQLSLVVLLPSGKIMLVGYSALTLGSVTRQQLLRLNADGTPDAGFNASPTVGSLLGNIINAVGQPDGKLVLTGRNAFAPGAGRLVRLLPDGTLDAAFQTALNNSAPIISRLGTNLVLQPDGKLIVPGTFVTQGVVRLLPTGALDPSFNAQLTVTLTFTTSQVALQADGKVLVTTINTGTAPQPSILRLTDTGILDPTFQLALINRSYYTAARVEHVQTDGKLLITGLLQDAAGNNLTFARLLPGGGLDPSFDATASLGATIPTDTQLLPNGQILVVKAAGSTNGLPFYRLVLLNPDGSIDPSLNPQLYTNGQVNDVVQLPGGGYLVGGDFSEINGMAAGNLAHLSASGVPDPTFLVMADNTVRALLVQPDGKLLVGGTFEHIAGTSRVFLARLLPSGTLDTSFAPPFLPIPLGLDGGINRLALQPDGRVLAAGGTKLTSAGTVESWLRRLDATTGQLDLSIPHYDARDMVVQPTGKVVVAGFYSAIGNTSGLGYCLFRLLPSGAPDPGFAPMPTALGGFGGGPVVTALAQSTTGRLYFTGYFYIDAGPPAPPLLYALQPDGQTITSSANPEFRQVASLAVQPNGRLLIGADLSSSTPTFGLSRVLDATLAPDPSFLSTSRPPAYTVNRILVQPDGAILAAGIFTSVGGQVIAGLVRLLDACVLSVSTQRLAARTQAWPVPAHGQLHLALDAASRPQRVELLDALGRAVLTQAVAQPELTLDTTPLPAGAYVLRVQYANGPVARRVVVE